MDWRKAIPEDYEEYERLYNDLKCETLYRGNEGEINPQKAKEALRYFGLDGSDKETEKMYAEEAKCTYEKFLANLGKDYIRIYMCMNGKKCVGFVQLSQIIRTKWKLGYLCLEPKYQTAKVIDEMTQYLHKKGKIKVIDVCTLGGKINGILRKIGYQETGSKYYFRKNRES